MSANGTSADTPKPDAATATAGAAEAAAGVPLTINAQYIKDLSFEVPGAPRIYAELADVQPEITVNIDVQAQAIQDTLFEVVIHIAAECKAKGAVAFLCELAYGGLFTVRVPREHVQAVLLIECPRLLFPFARNIVADATRDGGFPPLMLTPVDFVAMYQNQIARQGQAAAPATA